MNQAHSVDETLTKPLKTKSRSQWVARFAKAQMLKKLEALALGALTIKDGEDSQTFGNKRTHPARATIHVHDARFYGEVAFGGSIGAGEAYMLGYWTADSLVDVIRLMAVNQAVMDSLEGGYEWLSKPLMKVLHWLNSNTEAGSRKNIAAHYDLGNDLFELFLDPTMMYSSAMFNETTKTLQQASELKLETICKKLNLEALAGVVLPSMLLRTMAAK